MYTNLIVGRGLPPREIKLEKYRSSEHMSSLYKSSSSNWQCSQFLHLGLGMFH